MEGPSLTVAVEYLRPFKKKIVLGATGNTSLDRTIFVGRPLKDIFAWGKHLVLQFDAFALRVHFLLWGTYEAQVEGEWVTGDYRKARVPRLALSFENGVLNMYNCSLRILETKHARRDYDFSVDIMARKWDPAGALRRMREQKNAEIADVLLDQSIFSGVGNIIKNEVLSLTGIAPQRKIGTLKPAQMKAVIAQARAFSRQFYRWRKKFVLKKNLKAHRKSACPICGGKQIWKKTGKRERWSHWCSVCQT